MTQVRASDQPTLADALPQASPWWGRWGSWTALLAPLAVYLSIAAYLTPRHWEKLSPDGVAYLRRAMLLAKGDFYHSISGYWSPMLSWLTTPLLWLRIDGVHSLHFVLVGSGAFLLVTFWWFARSVVKLTAVWQLAAGVALALSICTLPFRQLTPDLLMAGFLFAYFTVATRQKRPMLAGPLAGAAYLAKAYALPFVVLHLVVTAMLRPDGTSRRQTFRKLAMAAVGLALVAGPWIGVLSWRYGRFTFSTTGSRAHAIVGPQGDGNHPHPYGRVPDPYISSEEVHELAKYPLWSPFSSRQNLSHQLGVIGDNSAAIASTFWSADVLHLSAVAVVAAIACLFLKQRGIDRRRIGWFLVTLSLFCGGYLLVYYTGRYVLPVVAPLCLSLALLLATRLEGRSRWAGTLLACAVVASVALSARKKISSLVSSRSPTLYRTVARQIRQMNLTGPIASSERTRGLFVAHHLNAKFLSVPEGRSPDDVEREVMADRPSLILVWRSIKSDDEPDAGFVGARGGAICACRPPATDRLMAPMLAKPQWKKVAEISPLAAAPKVKPKAKLAKAPAKAPASRPTTRKSGEYVEVYQWVGT